MSDKVWLGIRGKVINVLKNIFFWRSGTEEVYCVCQPVRLKISIRMSLSQMPVLIHLLL